MLPKTETISFNYSDYSSLNNELLADLLFVYGSFHDKFCKKEGLINLLFYIGQYILFYMSNMIVLYKAKRICLAALKYHAQIAIPELQSCNKFEKEGIIIHQDFWLNVLLEPKEYELHKELMLSRLNKLLKN